MRIALVEDEESSLRQALEFIRRFGQETGEKCVVDTFKNGLDFLSDYDPVYDLVLLDIKMPHMDGMSVAKKLRDMDGHVSLIFLTSMAQYALEGYAVSALDFAVKPVEYSAFAAKLKKALAHRRAHGESYLVLKLPAGMRRISSREVRYVEVMGHSLIFHLEKETLTVRGQLAKLEKELPAQNFVKCNSCYLVNLDHVTCFDQSTIFLGEDALSVSRRRKKEFLAQLTDYLGGKG